MAGAKKKKKPAVNPARGFATTSIASKPRPENDDSATNSASTPNTGAEPGNTGGAPSTSKLGEPSHRTASADKKTLSPEEFEKELEESELQLMVEKHAQKAKRDSQRQRNRLDIDRRLLRSQADLVNCPKWLPSEVMDQILHLIQAESRFPSSGHSGDNSAVSKTSSEEELILRLWTLQLTLNAVGFSPVRCEATIRHVLDIAAQVSSPVKDSIWGLEEALDWLARECSSEELPLYEVKGKPASKVDTSSDSPLPTRPATPQSATFNRGGKSAKGKSKTRQAIDSRSAGETEVTYDSDIEPEDLIPQYIDAKAMLLRGERMLWLHAENTDGRNSASNNVSFDHARMKAKVRAIESDVLFDKHAADMLWKSRQVNLEKEFAALKRAAQEKEPASDSRKPDGRPTDELSNDVNDEAEKIAEEILASDTDDDGEGIAGLFDSLPQSEVDPETGKSQTVLKSSTGSRLVLRDFGRWSGISPRRALEEACRSRDASVKIAYTVISEAAYANQQSVNIVWSKGQEIPIFNATTEMEFAADQHRFVFTMTGVATPDSKQSEAYVATAALFHIFSGNSKDEKVGLRLPPIWRDFWAELAEAKKSKIDAKDRVVVGALRKLVRQRRDQELEDGVILQEAFRGRGALKGSPDSSDQGGAERLKAAVKPSDFYRKIWEDKASTKKFQAMLQGRSQLPMWHFKQQVLDAVDHNQVVIVCGETGCGKSTQVPAFLMEHELSRGKPCKIYCTEPRRISALSLAKRVSEELGENKNDLGTSRSLVGYSIRLEANVSRETRLVYATTGIVMRMLEGSNDLSEVTHLVLDEVHERSIDSDFLLIVLKRLLKRREDLKVVLMSATVDAERFALYLNGAPILNVPGRTFPVQVRYLEDAIELTGFTPSGSPVDKMVDLDDEAGEGDDNGVRGDISKTLGGYSSRTRSTLSQLDEYQIEFDLIVQLIAHIAQSIDLQPFSRAILVFLPGIAEIRTLNDMLLGDPRFMREWLVYPLHSSIATEDQEAAFLVPPQGMRKIVLATNIAETGITIPDVTCVIDTGKHREMRFDERRQLSRLIDTFISRANAKQRRGRAGRVQEGLCFHMFTKHRHDSLLSDQQTPEMLRLSLQDLAIRVKICKIGGIEETLADALDPPLAKNIRRAIDALVDVRALTTGEELTPLGHQLARLPLDVFLGKLILIGSVFKCLDMALTIAAILSSKSPFSAPFGQRAQADNARAAFRRADSDVLTIYNAYLAWRRVCLSNSGHGKDFQFCRKNFLSQQTLANIEDLKGQLLTSLADSKFLLLTEDERRGLFKVRFAQGRRRQQHFFDVPKRVNINSDNDAITTAVIAWSFYPKLLVRDTPGAKSLRNVGNNQYISLHPSSVNRNAREVRWLSYYHIMQSKSVYHAHETTAAEPFAIALLCGDVRYDLYSGVIILDGHRARFALPDWKTTLAMKILRSRLRDLLTRSFKQPGKLPTAQHEKWFDMWQYIFSQELVEIKASTTGGEVQG